VGDSISAFAEVNPEDRSITLSHFNPTEADDMLAFGEEDGEVEEVEDEASMLLDRLEAEGSSAEAEPAEADADVEVRALDSRTLTAELYYEQSKTYPTSAAQSFLDASQPPLAFPQRPMVRDGKRSRRLWAKSCSGRAGLHTCQQYANGFPASTET
jgi:hypothetical protein